jgi:hypothetical protein
MHPLRKLREAGVPTYEALAAILAEDVVFNSPLLVRPIVGRDAVARTLVQSSTNRGGPGEYVLERRIDANGPRGRADLAFRPYPALRIFRERMKARLGDSVGPGMWDHDT